MPAQNPNNVREMARVAGLPAHVKKPCGSKPGDDDSQRPFNGNKCGFDARYEIRDDRGEKILVCGYHLNYFHSPQTSEYDGPTPSSRKEYRPIRNPNVEVWGRVFGRSHLEGMLVGVTVDRLPEAF